jgi:hypothetical protein
MKLRALGNDLQNASLSKASFALGNGVLLSTAQVIAEIAEAQAEWDKLDGLIIEARKQRRQIATRLGAFMDFVVLIRMHVRNVHRKPRRPLTLAEKVVAAAKLRLTRELRRTRGSRQKKHLKA